VLACLVATTIGLHSRGRWEIMVPHKQLSLFPLDIGNWRGADIPISPGEIVTLGPGEFLLRDYYRAADDPPVNLFIAYYQSQRSGDTIHSPKNCLPGAGWTPVNSSLIEIHSENGFSIHAKRYVLAQGASRMLVFYWYQAHGRTTPSEYSAKWFLASDAIRLNRTDGALVRVNTQIEGAEDTAEARSAQFVHEFLPLLDSYIPL
jgi:EpsI family protein